MTETGRQFDSLRLNRTETERLSLVIALSLAAHLLAFGGYEFSKALHLFPWLHFFQIKPQPAQAQQTQEPPLQFVMVQQPSTEPPQNTKYYSSQNSRAADKTHGNENDAQINGKQTDVPNVEVWSRPDVDKLQPQKPAKSQEQPLATEPGDLTLAKPSQLQPQKRPQKLSQVRPRLTGPQMLQNGASHRESLVPSLDAKATPFGSYDEAFIEAVQQRWYDLLDSGQFALDRTGKVVVRFRLNYDGTISDMRILQNTVGELLGHVCEDAIHDPAPYAAWTEDMRHTFGLSREITFTFYYY